MFLVKHTDTVDKNPALLSTHMDNMMKFLKQVCTEWWEFEQALKEMNRLYPPHRTKPKECMGTIKRIGKYITNIRKENTMNRNGTTIRII